MFEYDYVIPHLFSVMYILKFVILEQRYNLKRLSKFDTTVFLLNIFSSK